MLDTYNKMAAEDEEYEEAIEFLFYKGYEYEEIKELLLREYGIAMSLSSLKRRLKLINFARKNVAFDMQEVRQTIVELLDGPKSSVGYRSIWHSLRLRGIILPRSCAESYA